MRAAAVFESFNARALEPAEVAKTFVPPPHFGNLLKRRHTVLVGPRGSGKTTLLKMLQGPALEAWTGKEAEEFRRRIDYTGVFIPADQAWSQQLNDLGEGGLDQEHTLILGRAAFTTHVLLALLRAIHYRVRPPDNRKLVAHRRCPLPSSGEAELVRHLSGMWKLKSQVPSLASLALSLTARLSEIKELAQREILLPRATRGERLAANEWLFLGVLEAVVAGIEAFEQASGSGEARWALLFDELELAPQWARELLFASMRSVDQRLLFKLSLSPLSRDTTGSALSPAAGQDHDVIPLWYPHKEAAQPFCRALLSAILRARGHGEVTAEQLFGSSMFDAWEEPTPARTAYRRESPVIARFERLAARDASFAAYLRQHEINLAEPEGITGSQRAQLLRKITSIVAVRDAFLGELAEERGGRGRRRSRKNPGLYHGAASLFAITEGNPRLLIAMLDRLMPWIARGRVPVQVQNLEVKRAAALFGALLRTMPSNASSEAVAPRSPVPDRGVLALINAIGKRFSDGLIRDAFDPEPPGSFVVDSHTPDSILSGLEQAVNAGALIYVPDSQSELVLASMRGKRFRLSYLLAADFQLPLILMREVPLSRLINLRPGRGGGGRQETLFDGDVEQGDHGS